MNLRKEVKLSDLFRQRRRARGRSPAAPSVPQIPLMRAFNLLPREEVRQTTVTRRATPAQLGIAVAGLVLAAALASMVLITNATVADKERRRDELRSQLAARNIAAQAPAREEAGDAALVQERDARRAAVAGALGARIAWDRLLRDLSLVLPEDVWLRSLRGSSAVASADPVAPPPTDPAAAPKNTLEIVGYARGHEDVALLLSRMDVMPEIASVGLASAVATELEGEDVVDFTVRAIVKSQGQGATP